MDIGIQHISKAYGEHVVLADVSYQIPEGSIIGLMGPSGCGKTTLLRILMGLETADEGDLTGVPREISVVFQENRLCEEQSAVRNVKLVLDKRRTEEEVRENLKQVGISDEDFHKPVSEFSGGMKRRVAVVRAMMAESRLVILDEPFSGLDEGTKQQVLRYVKETRKGRSMLIVTHDPEDVEVLGGIVWEYS